MRAIVLLLLFLFTACEDRERLNPLDPENHLSHGAPTGLRVVSRRDTARLVWNSFEVNHLQAYEIYRGVEPDELIIQGSIMAENTFFIDQGLTYDQPYYYAVRALTEFSQSAISDPVGFTPGPQNVWVADMYGFKLRNISYDGKTITTEREYDSPRSVEYDPGEKIIWVADYFQKTFLGFTTKLKPKIMIPLPAEPIALTLDSLNQVLYTVLEDNTLYAFDYSGTILWQVDIDRELTLATELAYNALTENLWVSMSATNELLMIKTRPLIKERVVFTNLDNPGPLEADPLGSGVWVSTASGIARVDSAGNFSFYKTELFIHDLSLDPFSGDCYYTGSLERFSNWETGYLQHDHPEVSTVILDQSVPQIYNLQVVPGTGIPGILVQEADNHKLIRYSRAGEKLGETSGYSSHLDFALDRD